MAGCLGGRCQVEERGGVAREEAGAGRERMGGDGGGGERLGRGRVGKQKKQGFGLCVFTGHDPRWACAMGLDITYMLVLIYPMLRRRSSAPIRGRRRGWRILVGLTDLPLNLRYILSGLKVNAVAIVSGGAAGR